MEFNRDVLIGMLRQGNTGDQLLQILDVITSGISSTETSTDFVESVEVTV